MTDEATFEQEEISDIPDSWVWTTLADISEITAEKRDPQKYPNLPFIGLEHVEAHTMKLLGTVPASELSSNANVFGAGDVLYCRLRPYLNKVFRPEFNGLCSSEFLVFREHENLNNKYLQYFLNKWDFVAFATRQNEGDRPRVKVYQIEDYAFPLPPLNEQRRIVDEIEAQFTRLDAGIAALKRLEANLKRYKASVLKAACEGDLIPQNPDDEPASELLARVLQERREKWEAEQLARYEAQGKNPPKGWQDKYQAPLKPDTDDLPELPEGWVWASIEMLIESGPQNGLYLPQSRYGSGTPILRIEDYQIGWSKKSEELKKVEADPEEVDRYSLKEGDLVINRVNSPSHLGKSLVITSRQLPALFESNMMRLRLAALVNLRFVELYLHSLDGRQRLIKDAKWAVNQASINQGDVSGTAIAIPPLAEQRRIADNVDRLITVVDAEIEVVNSGIKRAERLRQSILKEAFAGQLVPQAPSDEPASELLKRIQAEGEGK